MPNNARLALIAGSFLGALAVGDRKGFIGGMSKQDPKWEEGAGDKPRNHVAKRVYAMRPEHYHRFDGVMPAETRQMRRAAARLARKGNG